MTAYAFEGGDERGIIPVLRNGSWRWSAPWLRGRAIDWDAYSESE